MEPGPGLNLVVGPNGHGKTNLLEAIWVLGGARSPRAADPARLVRLGAGPTGGEVEGALVLDSTGARREVRLCLRAAGARRAYAVNGKRVARVLDALGQVLVVWFSPDEVDVVRGSPAARRRFLDVALAQVDPRFREAAARYARALQQRNHALQRAGAGRDAAGVVEAWEGPLARAGALVAVRRHLLLAELAPAAASLLGSLTAGEGTLRLLYRPTVPEEAMGSSASYEAALLRRLGQLREAERVRRVTLAGPHREDFEVRLDGLDLRSLGSRGQHRAAAVALFLALWAWVSGQAGEPAILLLDDVASELDEGRRQRLARMLPAGAQVFATATEPSLVPVPAAAGARVWRVSNGQLELVSGR